MLAVTRQPTLVGSDPGSSSKEVGPEGAATSHAGGNGKDHAGGNGKDHAGGNGKDHGGRNGHGKGTPPPEPGSKSHAPSPTGSPDKGHDPH